jgi:hypothetical protein
VVERWSPKPLTEFRLLYPLLGDKIMEAKDTVIKNEDLEFMVSVEDALSEQAEVSFKAGMQEVVDFIKKRPGKKEQPIGDAVYLGLAWEAKLKEWGIK